jgi:hypothetical protein
VDDNWLEGMTHGIRIIISVAEPQHFHTSSAPRRENDAVPVPILWDTRSAKLEKILIDYDQQKHSLLN